MVCRVFSDYLGNGKQLLVRRAPRASDGNSSSETADSYGVWFSPKLAARPDCKDAAITVSLDNADELRTNDLATSTTAELGRATAH